MCADLRRSDIYACFNGGWACDGCAARDLAIMYHDYDGGDYDLCEPCYEAKQAAEQEAARHQAALRDWTWLDVEPLPAL